MHTIILPDEVLTAGLGEAAWRCLELFSPASLDPNYPTCFGQAQNKTHVHVLVTPYRPFFLQFTKCLNKCWSSSKAWLSLQNAIHATHLCFLWEVVKLSSFRFPLQISWDFFMFFWRASSRWFPPAKANSHGSFSHVPKWFYQKVLIKKKKACELCFAFWVKNCNWSDQEVGSLKV